jgi:hypothetical protein
MWLISDDPNSFGEKGSRSRGRASEEKMMTGLVLRRRLPFDRD